MIRPGPATAERSAVEHLVRVWFGEHPIIQYRAASPTLAAEYADAIGRRFAGLRVTNEPVGTPVTDHHGASVPILPERRLWDIPPP